MRCHFITPAVPLHINLPPFELPAQCDVIVVGAGPAGSAAALELARAGFGVVLVDQHAFPRDKVCGDGLIPDAHNALRRLGLLDEVLAQAQPAGHVGVIGPRGGRVDVPGTLSVLPRRELDLILCRGAAAAGARMFAPLRFMGPLESTVDGVTQVVGARLRSGDTTHELRAAWLLIASGALPQALLAAGMCERRTPSGVALRGYVRNPALVGRLTELEVEAIDVDGDASLPGVLERHTVDTREDVDAVRRGAELDDRVGMIEVGCRQAEPTEAERLEGFEDPLCVLVVDPDPGVEVACGAREAVGRKGICEVDGDGGLPHTAFTGEDHDDMLHVNICLGRQARLFLL
jgi:hypothetical protein